MCREAVFRSFFVLFTDAIRVVNTNFPAFLVVLIVLAGCDRAKTNQAQTQPNKRASFRDSIFVSVTPTADGGAYAIGDSGSIHWTTAFFANRREVVRDCL